MSAAEPGQRLTLEAGHIPTGAHRLARANFVHQSPSSFLSARLFGPKTRYFKDMSNHPRADGRGHEPGKGHGKYDAQKLKLEKQQSLYVF